jgi:Putative Flp pilus-assembly TadE/G-like
MKKQSDVENLKNQNGAVAIMVGFLLFFVLIGVSAIAVDLHNLMVTNNELKNAADAGALAGAQFLYNDLEESQSFITVNPIANTIAHDTVLANSSQGEVVENVLIDDVKRGHWSMALGNLSRGFYENESDMTLPEPSGQTEIEIDQMLSFVNAVKVRAKREALPVASWFSRIFGSDPFTVIRESVAYRSPAGEFPPSQFDTPFSVCKKYITDPASDGYDCSRGRVNNSGSNDSHQTGGLSNLSYPCDTANPGEVSDLACGGSGNSDRISTGVQIGVTNGTMPNVFRDWRACWNKTEPLKGTIPVIDCAKNNPDAIGPCEEVVGAATVWIVWITDNTAHPDKYDQIPTEMAAIPEANIDSSFACEETDLDNDGNELGAVGCWKKFAEHFKLTTPEDIPLSSEEMADNNYGFKDVSLYFIPTCDYNKAGGPGGDFYGVMSSYPVLVDREDLDNLDR